LNRTPHDEKIISATQIFTEHSDTVNDVIPSRFNPFLFASVSDDKKFIIHDSRTQSDRQE